MHNTENNNTCREFLNSNSAQFELREGPFYSKVDRRNVRSLQRMISGNYRCLREDTYSMQGLLDIMLFDLDTVVHHLSKSSGPNKTKSRDVYRYGEVEYVYD